MTRANHNCNENYILPPTLAASFPTETSSSSSSSSSVSCVSSITPNLLYVQFSKSTTNKESNPYEASVPDWLIACSSIDKSLASVQIRTVIIGVNRVFVFGISLLLEGHVISLVCPSYGVVGPMHPQYNGVKSFAEDLNEGKYSFLFTHLLTALLLPDAEQHSPSVISERRHDAGCQGTRWAYQK